jgi:hypothetical protein
MTQIIISTLQPNSIKTFLHNLTVEKAETILGSFYPSGIGILNVTDSTYIYNSPRLDRRYWAVGPYSSTSNENDFNSVNYSRSIYNRFL